MFQRDKFLREQKVLRLSTIGRGNIPHIVPVWYMYRSKKIFVGTNTRTQKVKNVKKNKKVAFCVDVGINSPDIYGVLGQGEAIVIVEKSKVKQLAKKILSRYFDSIKSKSAKELLDDTDCIIQIIPKKTSVWSY